LGLVPSVPRQCFDRNRRIRIDKLANAGSAEKWTLKRLYCDICQPDDVHVSVLVLKFGSESSCSQNLAFFQIWLKSSSAQTLARFWLSAEFSKCYRKLELTIMHICFYFSSFKRSTQRRHSLSVYFPVSHGFVNTIPCLSRICKTESGTGLVGTAVSC